MNGKFQSKINRSNGSRVFQFSEETTTNSVSVPEKITIAIAPFIAADPIQLEIYLRFRIEDGKPRFQIVIPSGANEERKSLLGLFIRVKELTGASVLVGP